MNNMKNEIQLTLDTTLDEAHGNEYGLDVFNKQIKNKMKYDLLNVIVFPNFISDISASFVQGLCSELKNRYNRKEIYNHILFKTNDIKLDEKANGYIDITW